MRKIVAVVSVFSNAPLLFHFVKHYHRLGIDKLCVGMNVDFSTSEIENEYGDFLRVHRTQFSRFSDSNKSAIEESMLSEESLDLDDWVLHLDLDEFHSYPAHIREIASVAQARNIWAIAGNKFDRVATDGTLQSVRVDIPLDDQFPLGGYLTGPLVSGCTRKVMMCRRRVKLSAGRHSATNADLGRWPIGTVSAYRVHHFRWTLGLIQRLEGRWDDVARKKYAFVRTNLAFCANYRKRGRINIDDPKLRLMPAHLTYPDKYAGFEQLAGRHSGWWLDAAELEELAQFIREHNVKTVLEFGPGRSTAALVGCGCHVVSLEADKQMFETQKAQYSHPNVKLHQYEAGHPIRVDLPDKTYDLCLIDGPRGTKRNSRLDSVLYAMSRTNLMLLHDSKRPGEQDTSRFLVSEGWTAKKFKRSKRGMAIFSKKPGVVATRLSDPIQNSIESAKVLSVIASPQLREPAHKWLVFTSAGDRSNLKYWLGGNIRFDLWVAYYGDHANSLTEFATYYNARKAGKFPNLHFVYQTWPELLTRYDAILVLDDDVIISGSDISRLFQIREQRDLWLLQPAFDPSSKISHPITKVNHSTKMRFVNFVEVGCPLFQREKLDEFMKVYDPVLVGWGVDWWYLQVLGPRLEGKVAIVDEVTCINPKVRDGGGPREIDVLQPQSLRVATWNLIRDREGITSHTNGALEYSSVPKDRQ